MLTRWTFVSCVWLTLVVAQPAAADPLADQSNNLRPSITASTIIGPWGGTGQEFVPRFTKHLGVRLLLLDWQSLRGDELPPAPLTVNVREDGVVGPIVATVQREVFGQPPFGPTQFPRLYGSHFVEIMFESPVYLEPGRLYFLELVAGNRRGAWSYGQSTDERGPAGRSFLHGSSHWRDSYWVFETIVDVVDAAELEADLADTDADGVLDSMDACPETPEWETIDAQGCSRDQFCRGVKIDTRRGVYECMASDWMNDEPLKGPFARDCRIDPGRRGRGDELCVAAN